MEAASDTKPVAETVTMAAGEAEEESSAELYIDSVKEKAIMRKFDLFAMPQFVIIAILGKSRA